VEVERRELEANHEQPRGRVAHLIADGFFQTARIKNEAYTYWKARGFTSSSARIYEAIDSLIKDGFLVGVEGGKVQQHPLLKVVKRGERTVTLTIHYK
jgi:hypothetical protein